MLEEFASQLQFPDYFGANLDALEEMLTDLSWLPTDGGHLIMIADPDEVLVGHDDELRRLIDVLLFVQNEWAAAVDPADVVLHPSLPFYMVLADDAPPESIGVRWRAQGVLIRSVPSAA
jgi:RNAse (barnase) inhibitor barstar